MKNTSISHIKISRFNSKIDKQEVTNKLHNIDGKIIDNFPNLSEIIYNLCLLIISHLNNTDREFLLFKLNPIEASDILHNILINFMTLASANKGKLKEKFILNLIDTNKYIVEDVSKNIIVWI
jgi:hypothetical protein